MLAQCCGRYLDGEAAPTAEALMRSRYTAFALRDEENPDDHGGRQETTSNHSEILP